MGLINLLSKFAAGGYFLVSSVCKNDLFCIILTVLTVFLFFFLFFLEALGS